MQKTLKIGYRVFIAVVVALALLFVVSLFPIAGNYKIKVVMSGSMEPAIKTGSMVVIKPQSAYIAGDVITFGKDNKKDIPTTHRIQDVRVEAGSFIFRTKGDANESADLSEVAQKDVIGKVIFSIPFLGYILDFAKKPLGFALLIGVPSVAIVLSEIGTIFAEVRRMRNPTPKA